MNSNIPCISSEATNFADPQHSGAKQASPTSSIVIFDTSFLNTLSVFAVCYDSGAGTSSSTTWKDSGIRLALSKILTVNYGQGSTTYPARAWNSLNTPPETNRLPQAPNIVVTYVGDLGFGKWISFIDVTLNGNNPCVSNVVAASVADDQHSGNIPPKPQF